MHAACYRSVKLPVAFKMSCFIFAYVPFVNRGMSSSRMRQLPSFSSHAQSESLVLSVACGKMFVSSGQVSLGKGPGYTLTFLSLTRPRVFLLQWFVNYDDWGWGSLCDLLRGKDARELPSLLSTPCTWPTNSYKCYVTRNCLQLNAELCKAEQLSSCRLKLLEGQSTSGALHPVS